jgi:autotransporter-associated beta strand protein
VKLGANTLTLSGNNTYTGATTVSAGTLLINGSTSSSSAVNVSSGAILGGNGTIGGAVNVNSGGFLAPGNSPGLLTVGSLTLNSGSTTAFEINNITTRGTDYDAINITVASGLTLNGTFTINFTSGTALANTTNINLFGYTGTHTGDFASMTSTGFYPSGLGGWTHGVGDVWTLSSGGQTLTFSEGTGYLNVVPEPATWALLAFSLTTVMVLRRRRNS